MVLKTYYELTKDQVSIMLPRATTSDRGQTAESVSSILETVKAQGDYALFEYTRSFDNVELSSLFYPKERIAKEGDTLPESLKSAIQIAAANIKKFHENQKVHHSTLEVSPGVYCWQKSVPYRICWIIYSVERLHYSPLC